MFNTQFQIVLWTVLSQEESEESSQEVKQKDEKMENKKVNMRKLVNSKWANFTNI